MTTLNITVNLDLIPRGEYGHVVAEALREYANLVDLPYTRPGDIGHAVLMTPDSQIIGRVEVRS